MLFPRVTIWRGPRDGVSFLRKGGGADRRASVKRQQGLHIEVGADRSGLRPDVLSWRRTRGTLKGGWGEDEQVNSCGR